MNFTGMIPVLGSGNGTVVSHWAVFLVTLGILGLALRGCLISLRREQSNRVGVSALLPFLVAAGLYGAGRLAHFHGLSDWPGGAALRLTLLVLGIGAALVGLVGLGLHRRAHHLTGRTHAVLAVITGSILSVVTARELAGMLESVARTNTAGAPVVAAAVEASTPPAPTPSVPAATPPAPTIAEVSKPSTPEPTPAPTPEIRKQETQTIGNAELGYQLELPKQWKENGNLPIDGSTFKVYIRTWPSVGMMVIAQNLPGLSKMDKLAESAMRKMESAGEILDQSSEDVRIGEHDFRCIRSRLKPTGQSATLRYEHWLNLSEHGAYQIIFWSSNLAPARLTKETRPIIESFRLLDNPAGKRLIKEFKHPELGLAVELADDWIPLTEPANPLFQCRVQRAEEAFQIAALPDISPETPLSYILSASVDSMGLTFDESKHLKPTPLKLSDGLSGLEWQHHHEDQAGTSLDYLTRVVRGEKMVWLVQAWWETKEGNADITRRSMDAIRFQSPAGEQESVSEVSRRKRAIFWNGVGLEHYNREDYAAAATLMRKAFELSGKTDMTMLGNAGQAMENAGNHADGIPLLAPFAGKSADRRRINLLLGRLHVLAGDVPAGVRAFLLCDDGILKEESELLGWMKFLNKRDHTAAAIESAEDWIRRAPSMKSKIWLAQTYSQDGNHDKAIGLFRKLCEENPDNVDLRHELAEHLNGADKHEEAAGVAQAIIADGKATARTHTALGWSHFGRRWYKEAKSSFEEAARLAPNDAEIQSYIREAAAKLGQGNNASITAAITPVAVPDALAKLLKKSRMPEDFGKNHAGAWVQRSTGYAFKSGEPLRRTIRMKVRVLDAEGVDSFSTIRFPFDPLYEKVHLNKLEVRNAKDERISSVKSEDAYVRDDDDGTANHDQILFVHVPGVSIGCTVSWEITVQTLSHVTRFPYERNLISNFLPTFQELVFVTGDVDAIKAELAQGKGVETPEGSGWKAWIASNKPPAENEPMAVWPEERYPYLTLAGIEGTWADIGKRYLGDIKDRSAVEPQVRELAQSLTKDCPDVRTKVAVLSRYVQKNIAYKAIEFGVRARRPNSSSETLRLHYGDCKDTALLLNHMLTAAGIKSHLALVQTEWRLIPSLPSLDQFNHMIVHVPELGPNHLIDPTDKTLDIGKFAADNLWHAQVLSLDPENPRLLERTPTAAPGSCDATVRRTVSLDGQAWRVDESLSLTGYYASSMRSAFLGINPEQQQRRAQGILSAHGNVRLESFVFHGLDDPEAPARLHMIYNVQVPMPVIGGARHASLPALWEKDYLSTTFVKDRKWDFRINYPFVFTSETTLLPPPDLLPESLTALGTSGKSQWGEWKLEPPVVNANPAQPLVFKFQYSHATGTFPAASYRSYHETWETVRALWDKTIAWKEKPAVPTTPQE